MTRLLNRPTSRELTLTKSEVIAMIVETFVQDSPTALSVYSYLGYVFRPTPVSKWVWVWERNLLWHFYAQCISSGNVCWVVTGLGGVQPPFFAIPSFMFKSAFWADLLMSFGQLCMRWSRLLHPKQFLLSFWYNSITLAIQTIYSITWGKQISYCLRMHHDSSTSCSCLGW